MSVILARASGSMFEWEQRYTAGVFVYRFSVGGLWVGNTKGALVLLEFCEIICK